MSARGPFAVVDEHRNVWVDNDVVAGGALADRYAAHLNAAHADLVAAELEALVSELRKAVESRAFPVKMIGIQDSVKFAEFNMIQLARYLADSIERRAKAIREGGA